jgi:SAM-dependent methyltransferase
VTPKNIYKNSRRKFYENIDRDKVYTSETNLAKHPFYRLIDSFIAKWNLKDKKCMEIGCSKGLFQDLVQDYTGIDIAANLSRYYHKKFVVASGAFLPFCNEAFDGIFAYAAHEHIPELEESLTEIVRILKPGGVCLFSPAWHTRSWFAKGYQVRSYSELIFREKVVKFSILFREFILIRWPITICRRIVRLCAFFLNGKRPGPLKYKKLNPNYEVYWQSDSDACNSIDPFDVIIWFKSRGVICHGYEGCFKMLTVRTYALELQKNAM